MLVDRKTLDIRATAVVQRSLFGRFPISRQQLRKRPRQRRLYLRLPLQPADQYRRRFQRRQAPRASAPSAACHRGKAGAGPARRVCISAAKRCATKGFWPGSRCRRARSRPGCQRARCPARAAACPWRLAPAPRGGGEDGWIDRAQIQRRPALGDRQFVQRLRQAGPGEAGLEHGVLEMQRGQAGSA